MKAPARTTRRPVQAGRFYPGTATELAATISGFLKQVESPPTRGPKAVIAPHAGYAYSGPVAASAFAPWVADAGRIRRVVVMGPSHWVDFRGVALADAMTFATPLGDVPVDEEGVELALGNPGVVVYDTAHSPEHCVEVELPFLQVILSAFTIVPLVVGRETDARVQAVVEALWGGDETRFVLSSDLSHYLDYEEARRLDRGTADLVERGGVGELSSRRACGYRPIRGFLEAAGPRGLKAHAVDLRNSGDTAGRQDSVVGYGAFHFFPS